MPSTASQIADLLEYLARNTLTQFEGITSDDFNRPLKLPESNTLFALATHLVSAGEFWTLVVVGKRAIPRDRPAEFHATGRVEELQVRYEHWIRDVHEVLDTFPDERLDEMAKPADDRRDRDYNVREALLHAVEHSALHLGHIQLTRQFLGYAPPGE